MIHALPRQGQLGDMSFVVVEHDRDHPLRPQRDRVGLGAAALLGPGAEGVSLRRRPGRKPLLDGVDRVGCSIAHCGRYSLLGVARGREPGVDLEAVRPELDLSDMAAAFFTAEEVRWLGAQPRAGRPLATTLLWCAKEAYLKATGRGVVAGLRTPPLDGLDLSPLLDGAFQLAAGLPGTGAIQLHHGHLGTEHLVLAAVLLRSG